MIGIKILVLIAFFAFSTTFGSIYIFKTPILPMSCPTEINPSPVWEEQNQKKLDEIESKLSQLIQNKEQEIETNVIEKLEGILPLAYRRFVGPHCQLRSKSISGRRVAILIPYNPALPKGILDIMFSLSSRIKDENPFLNISVIYDSREESRKRWEKKEGGRGARVRNRMIQDLVNLEDFDNLCWVDHDIISYDPAMFTPLIMTNPEGVVAPLILIEGERSVESGIMFYDTTAFKLPPPPGINSTKLPVATAISQRPPYFPGSGPNDCVELFGVGAFYCTSVEPYKNGVKHSETHPYTEHWTVSDWIRKNGGKVICNKSMKVWHAHLPKWGLKWH